MSEEKIATEKYLKFIKSLAKTLGQLALYKIGHPAVTHSLQELGTSIQNALAESQRGEILFSMDGDAVIANGRRIANANSLPTAFTSIFKRFKLNLLTFKAGISQEELASFCELCMGRPGDALEINSQVYLSKRGVVHILLNEAIYGKLSKIQDTSHAEAMTPTQEPAIKQDAFSDALNAHSLDLAAKALIEKAVPDPKERERIYRILFELIEKDIQNRLSEVVKKNEWEKAVLTGEQNRAQNVIQNMMDGAIVVDDQGKVLMMNPAAEAIYGLNLADAAGLPLAIQTGTDKVIALSAQIGTIESNFDQAVTATVVNAPVVISGEEKTARDLRATSAIVQNQAGKVVGMIATPSDSIKLKEIELLKQDFVAHITHELRAPLTSIRAALEILGGQISDRAKPEDSHLIEMAVKNSDRLASLINSILDFSKIESGQMTVYPRKTDAEKIIKEAIDSLAPWAQKKGIALSYESTRDLPPLWADPQRTLQVLINLISNAIKFTPQNEKISIRVELFKDARMILFSVTDTGRGIPESDHKRIFEKFVQILSGETRHQGTGLGLPIAKALIHLQGGQMWLESSVGKGSTFLFTLPIYSQPREDINSKPAIKKISFWKRLLIHP